ncbi:alpha/beta fold hydrolase [Paractinoplanes lichenicola]|uniref:Alpha/beta fold hydrolase n=1 Tax=Paractinoplanes lichenicola TaxID=2802976 RepID=A0ABS1VTQ6_9ACTN|nr:alpha/beta fold hydrolase [Actinoplanes lichenicola]MBL7257832.1 alpha/beta fold hydrolase [Actinoplanes lichenicola]
MLHVHHYGDGPSIVALHGLTGHGRRFRRLAEHGLRIHAPDLRGHGHSTSHPPWTLEQHARDVIATLDTPVVLVGHSFGATVAVHVTRIAPELVKHVVLLDPGHGLPPALAEQLATAALTPPAYPTPEDAARDRAAGWPPQAHDLIDDEVRQHLVREKGVWTWRHSTPMTVAAYSELARPPLAPAAGTPTTLVKARRSKAVPPGYADLCGVTAIEIDSGHQVHLERPAETAQVIHDAISGTA